VLDLPDDIRERLAKLVPIWGYQDPNDLLIRHLPAAGCDPRHPRIRAFAALWTRIQDLPRHLGQHSGGMVIAAGRLDDIVPLEPATMPGRVVIQWDKDDCAALGIIKVDLLGLRMMSVIQEAIQIVSETGGEVDLGHLPADDPKVYRMLRQADTIGVFQVESRAQMATLPRIQPEHFYDLVVQVAIIRPGPIVGNMVHPYIRRRRGREPVTYPHPSLEPILQRTLGVPLFQEQLLRMADTLEAMVDADVLKFLRYHYDIKKYIAACARNPFAASAIAPAHAMSRRFYYLHYRRAHDLPVAARHHAEVIRAIASGDEARAGASADRLMDYVEELTRATVTQKL